MNHQEKFAGNWLWNVWRTLKPEERNLIEMVQKETIDDAFI